MAPSWSSQSKGAWTQTCVIHTQDGKSIAGTYVGLIRLEFFVHFGVGEFHAAASRSDLVLIVFRKSLVSLYIANHFYAYVEFWSRYPSLYYTCSTVAEYDYPEWQIGGIKV
jgi:hypothetical protein